MLPAPQHTAERQSWQHAVYSLSRKTGKHHTPENLFCEVFVLPMRWRVDGWGWLEPQLIDMDHLALKDNWLMICPIPATHASSDR